MRHRTLTPKSCCPRGTVTPLASFDPIALPPRTTRQSRRLQSERDRWLIFLSLHARRRAGRHLPPLLISKGGPLTPWVPAQLSPNKSWPLASQGANRCVNGYPPSDGADDPDPAQ